MARLKRAPICKAPNKHASFILDIDRIRAGFLTSLKRGYAIFGHESHGRHEQGSD